MENDNKLYTKFSQGNIRQIKTSEKEIMDKRGDFKNY